MTLFADYSFRMLVYEYVDNGTLEQWLHGDVGLVSPLTWDIRMKIAVGTAKGCVYGVSCLVLFYIYLKVSLIPATSNCSIMLVN